MRNKVRERRRRAYKEVRKYSSPDLLQALCHVREKQPDQPSYKTGSDFNLRPVEKEDLREYIPEILVAALSDMAMRWSNPHRGSEITVSRLFEVLDKVYDYIFYDPVLDPAENKEVTYVEKTLHRVRIAGLQLPFQSKKFGNHSRPLYMYKKLDLSLLNEFDFYDKFEEYFGVSLEEFIQVGFIIAAASSQKDKGAFKFDYFEEAKNQGVNLPERSRLITAMENYVGGNLTQNLVPGGYVDFSLFRRENV